MKTREAWLDFILLHSALCYHAGLSVFSLLWARVFPYFLTPVDGCTQYFCTQPTPKIRDLELTPYPFATEKGTNSWFPAIHQDECWIPCYSPSLLSSHLLSLTASYQTKLWPHRIIQYPELEGTHRDHQVQLLSLHQESKSTGRLGAATAFLGSLFQCPTMIWVKKSPKIQPKPPLTKL